MAIETDSRSNTVKLEFTPEAFQILESLTKRINGTTRAVPVRFGLRLLEWVLEQKAAGNKILTEAPNGAVSDVNFSFLS